MRLIIVPAACYSFELGPSLRQRRSQGYAPHLVHNWPMGRSASKRVVGQIRNIAQQLVQIATGWEASFDGLVFLSQEKTSGHYAIDVINGVSVVNASVVELGMAHLLGKWIKGELSRLNREPGWLTEATVTVRYALQRSEGFMDSHEGFWTSEAFVALLSATAHVVTGDGAAGASLDNYQALIGQHADPVRPI